MGKQYWSQNFQLKEVLNASKANKPVFPNSIEAYIDQYDDNLLIDRQSGLDIGLNLSYVTPFLVFVQFIRIVFVYVKLQQVRMLFHGRIPEFVALLSKLYQIKCQCSGTSAKV